MLLSGGLSLGHLFPQVLSESCLSEALLKIKDFTEEQRFPFKSWRILFSRQVIFSKAFRNRWERLSQLLTRSHASCLVADKSMATENPKAEVNPIVALCLAKLVPSFLSVGHALEVGHVAVLAGAVGGQAPAQEVGSPRVATNPYQEQLGLLLALPPPRAEPASPVFSGALQSLSFF